MSMIKFTLAFGRCSSCTPRGIAFQSFVHKKPFMSSVPSTAISTRLSFASSSFDPNKEEGASTNQKPSSSSSSVPNDVLIVDKMPPPLPLQLKHKYYLLRHGQSEGNVEGVISSCRSLKYSTKHGLTPLGYQQGYDSAKSLLDLIQTSQQPQDDSGRNPTRVFFYSSPFARAKQTAQACMDGLLTLANQDQEGITTTTTTTTTNACDTGRNNTVLHLQDKMLDIQTDIILKDGLMERYFGQLDGLPLSTYAYVWPEDKKDVTFTGRFHVESVAAVATRLREVILEIEQSDLHKVNHDHQHEDVIVLTSHADVLQILQLYASGKDNVGEFSSYRFGNGEVRFMGRTPDTLPEPCPLEVPTDLPVL